MYPLNAEYKLEKTFSTYTDKLLKAMKKVEGKKNVGNDLQKALFTITEESKEQMIKELGEVALEINLSTFESWRSLSVQELERGDLTGAKAWIKQNILIMERMPKILSEQLQKERLRRIDETRKIFNASFQTRIGKLESGEISYSNLSRMKDTLKGIPNPNKEIKNLIESLDNYHLFTKEEIKALSQWTNRRNELWARNETGNFYSADLKEMWAHNQIEEFIWMTEDDEKVRETHFILHLVVIAIADALFLPGEEPGCRCWAKPVN